MKIYKITLVAAIFILSLYFLYIHNNSKLYNEIELYLVENQLSYENHNNIDIDKVTLSKPPLLDSKNILSYQWDTHELFLDEEGWKKINNFCDKNFPGAFGIPFVIALDQNPIYYGFFWTSKSSFKKGSSSVIIFENLKEKRFVIEVADLWEYIFYFLDRRNDKRIYSYLKKSNKLR